MRHPPRKIAFVLAASDHGPLIVNRFDYKPGDDGNSCGVGFQIFERSVYDAGEVDNVVQLLQMRRRYFGDGVVALDCGANIGVHTVECAKAMTGWGAVVAIEAQERLYYALAGNIALNNCFNARAVHAAVAAADGTLDIPNPDYLRPASFGSLELRQKEGNEFIGQVIDYRSERAVAVRALRLDSLGLDRVDLVKLDVEGMEAEALAGAPDLIARHRPILLIEWIKSAKAELQARLEAAGYTVFEGGINLLAVHRDDKTLGHIGATPPPGP